MLESEALTGEVDQLRRAYGCFPSGVAAVCSMVDGEPVGMAVSSFTSVSMDPPLVSVSVQHSSTTWPRLRGASRLGVSVLTEGQDAACVSLSRRGGDRFAGIEWQRDAAGAVMITGATAWLDCSLHGEVPAGDHSIALLRIHRLCSDPSLEPLVFHGSRFRRLVGI
ncbi:flavin reductase (plasmid) [Pseudonocardia sp. EC080610-09]|uniref:flavin reductase family protein n=1 Tax=unclassified Pseudonocardia TaxID=2619320 RepID=UPI000706A79D|nr:MULTISPECIES: flavin reductase family protein [unclassified Pseudonocardia]ALL79751.1 flavin reductase [Pseudonocardia sp. EC080610-09]ALL85186.1 flavin reductase [Pseudonocardia sp. EC080619-01]